MVKKRSVKSSPPSWRPPYSERSGEINPRNWPICSPCVPDYEPVKSRGSENRILGKLASTSGTHGTLQMVLKQPRTMNSVPPRLFFPNLWPRSSSRRTQILIMKILTGTFFGLQSPGSLLKASNGLPIYVKFAPRSVSRNRHGLLSMPGGTSLQHICMVKSRIRFFRWLQGIKLMQCCNIMLTIPALRT